MSSVPKFERSPTAFGMTSLVIGSIGLLLSVLPVLGIPISLLGFLLGITALVVNRRAGGAPLRWSLAGVAVCGGALVTGIALYYAPSGYERGPNVPQMWRTHPARPEVSPPSN
jgi:hypothetical protein